YKYDLEYGSAEVEVHKSDIQKGWNVLVHDDLLATGGTACAAAELISQLDAKVAGFAFVISLDFLQGNKRLAKYSKNIISLKNY
ncbi:MAG TPA: adenine phosphoribosyltransferase, partial [Flavobacteriales bacterium]|nr:adenine phosphoribosyltransferase [Flavobacteriales bacterium]